MSKKEIIKRYISFIVSLFFIGLGIAFSKQACLGISPVSSVANVLSIKFSFFSLGSWLIITNLLLLLGQIVILRKNFKPLQLLQIPLSFLFGYFTDFWLLIIKYIPNDSYTVKLGLLAVGIFFIGLGVAFGVIADIIMNSPEAFIKVLAEKTHKDFSTMKVIFDVCWVGLAVVLSLVFFSGKLEGVREGTVITAVLVGFVVKFIRPTLQKRLTEFFKR